MTRTDTGWRPAVARNRLGPATIVRWAGWLMLSVGVLLAGFFVYEMFITSFFAGRAQAGLTDDLN